MNSYSHVLHLTRGAGQIVGMSEMATAVRASLREQAAEEIRVQLARKRISAAELARRTGMKQSTLARRMTGEIAFDLDDLELIANVLGVAVVDLLPRALRATMDRNSPRPERPIPAPRRPADNRPTGQPSAAGPPGPRRTARVPRATRH